MKDRIQHFLLDFVMAVQARKVYSAEHPQFIQHGHEAFQQLDGLLQESSPLIFGLIEGELAWENEVFIDLSRRIRSILSVLQDRGIERLVFRTGLKEAELILFISLLLEFQTKSQIDFSDHLKSRGVHHIEAGRLRAPVETAAGFESEESSPPARESAVDRIMHLIQSLHTESTLDTLELLSRLKQFLQVYSGTRVEFLDLADVRQKDAVTYIHLLNVSILAMFFTSRLGYSTEDVRDIGTAALFHDIGKIHVDGEILSKSTRLEENEFFKIQHHTVLGAHLLLKHTQTLGILPVIIAYEHHLRYDRTGYPRLSFSVLPHPASHIVTICDVYDALAQRRSYKKDYSPKRIYEVMIAEKGRHFEPELIERFFQFLGVWPKGTIVSLTDGSVGIVREADDLDIFRPHVEIIAPEDKKGLIRLREAPPQLAVERALNPYAEGRDYLPFL